MTNKTDDMPAGLWVCKKFIHFPEYDGATGYEYFRPVESYTPPVEITDQCVKEAEKYFLMICEGMALDRDAPCNPELRVIRQALTDYGQMVACINAYDAAGYSAADIDRVDHEFSAIIKKCRGKDNG